MKVCVFVWSSIVILPPLPSLIVVSLSLASGVSVLTDCMTMITLGMPDCEVVGGVVGAEGMGFGVRLLFGFETSAVSVLIPHIILVLRLS